MIDELEAANAELRAALEKYGEHERDCGLTHVQAWDPKKGFKRAGKWSAVVPLCTCGLTAAPEAGK